MLPVCHFLLVHQWLDGTPPDNVGAGNLGQGGFHQWRSSEIDVPWLERYGVCCKDSGMWRVKEGEILTCAEKSERKEKVTSQRTVHTLLFTLFRLTCFVFYTKSRFLRISVAVTTPFEIYNTHNLTVYSLRWWQEDYFAWRCASRQFTYNLLDNGSIVVKSKPAK